MVKTLTVVDKVGNTVGREGRCWEEKVSLVLNS